MKGTYFEFGAKLSCKYLWKIGILNTHLRGSSIVYEHEPENLKMAYPILHKNEILNNDTSVSSFLH